ncbi:MAG: cysteine synthase family protein [Bryobacteraceae bacterium]|jgi:cysteine synthase A
MPDVNRISVPLLRTPLVPVQLDPSGPAIWVKLDFLQPSGSTKDRIAAFILDRALAENRLAPGGLVIEASSGSTSIALAMACAQRGLRFLAVMPEGVSNERVLMIRGFGGQVELTAGTAGVADSIARTEELARQSGAFLPCQFSNPDNARAHQFGSAREILEQIPGGRVDAVVSGVGTGGTLVGLYQGLRPANPALRAVLARPVAISETVDQECCSFSSQIPGVVDGVSRIFHPSVFECLQTVEVPQEEALRSARGLIRLGFPVGPSSGLNYVAAVRAANAMEPGAQVVTVFPDRMERYFTTRLFDHCR